MAEEENYFSKKKTKEEQEKERRIRPYRVLAGFFLLIVAIVGILYRSGRFKKPVDITDHKEYFLYLCESSLPKINASLQSVYNKDTTSYKENGSLALKKQVSDLSSLESIKDGGDITELIKKLVDSLPEHKDLKSNLISLTKESDKTISYEKLIATKTSSKKLFKKLLDYEKVFLKEFAENSSFPETESLIVTIDDIITFQDVICVKPGEGAFRNALVHTLRVMEEDAYLQKVYESAGTTDLSYSEWIAEEVYRLQNGESILSGLEIEEYTLYVNSAHEILGRKAVFDYKGKKYELEYDSSVKGHTYAFNYTFKKGEKSVTGSGRVTYISSCISGKTSFTFEEGNGESKIYDLTFSDLLLINPVEGLVNGGIRLESDTFNGYEIQADLCASTGLMAIEAYLVKESLSKAQILVEISD
ncbi:MAG: hypothetical protein K6B75_05650 [Lachnospiraceae bacterium]|nr:hypothetical protein [Lachnospiraceae bacterium]